MQTITNNNMKKKPKEEVKYPQLINEDYMGRLIAYSRGCVSWEPHTRGRTPNRRRHVQTV